MSKKEVAEKKPAAKVIAPKPRPVNPIQLVIDKYTAAGWTVLAPPKGGLVDVMAHKGQKLHFCQIITPDATDSVKFQGLPRNTFIQNAFSNSAAPIYVRVDPTTSKVTFEDVNQNTRVVITTRAPATIRRD